MKSKNGTDGSYVYTGTKNILQNKISKGAFRERVIKLLINIDGLPLYNISSIQLWPTLIQILQQDYICKPFVAGMFCSDSKPASANVFFEDLVEKCVILIEERIQIGDTRYELEFTAFALS